MLVFVFLNDDKLLCIVASLGLCFGEIQKCYGTASNTGKLCSNAIWYTLQNMNDSYRNDPKFSDRSAWANSAAPDQTAPSSNSSNFRVITTNFLGIRISRKFTVCVYLFFFHQTL